MDVGYERQRLLVARLHAALGAGRLDEAFRVADELVALGPAAETWEVLLCPVDRAKTGFDDRRLHRLLAELPRAPRGRRAPGGRLAPWRLHLRVILLWRLGWIERALVESEALAALPARWAWTRFNRGLMLHQIRWSYREAAAEYAAALAAAPSFWKARAARAEVELCRGRTRQAFRLMDACVGSLRHSPLRHDWANAVVWRGEMRLWIGQYREALADLEAGADEGMPLSLCWRGAALLKLGRLDEALRDLDASLRAVPDDAEALTWRAEARRLAGRDDEALEDAARALRLSPHLPWPRINRALVLARRGDEAGLRSDLGALRPELVRLFESRLGLDADRDADSARRVLEAILDAARGIRRGDGYLTPLWLDV